MCVQHDRIKQITEYLKENHSASVNELVGILGVSLVTVRKDLTVMEKQGTIVRTHGGALLNEKKDVESEGGPTRISIPSAYSLIADMAAQHIQPGDYIFLGSGKTCYALAEKIRGMKGISVITNNVSAACMLKPYVNSLILLGGELELSRDGVLSTMGPNVHRDLDGIYVDRAFTSCVGIDSRVGLTVNVLGGTYVDKCIPHISGEWYLLADSKKFNTKAFYKAGDVEQLTGIISDITDEKVIMEYTKTGVKFICPTSQEK